MSCIAIGALTGACTGAVTGAAEVHPFFTLERGFVKAGELRYSDTLVDANGTKLHLDEKSKAYLENPVTI